MLQIARKTCKICDRKAEGTHFGVISCRACAAFFRRNAGSKMEKKECMTDLCGDKKLCKPCRLRKCTSSGMTASKFQFDRDLNSTSRIIPQSFDIFTGRPKFVSFFHEPSGSATLINVTNLIDKATSILKLGLSWTPHIDKGPLRRFANCHNVYDKLPITLSAAPSLFSPLDTATYWEHYFLTTATWLTNFYDFQELGIEVKVKILEAVWHMFARLDRLSSTALARRRGQIQKKTMIAQSNGVFADVEVMKLDMRWTSQYQLEEIEFFLDGYRNWVLMDTVDQLIELDPSEIELTYMLAQLSFEYAGKRYQGEILKICERFQEILADDLHSYYVNERGMSNYSRRLAGMMKVNNAIQKSVWEHRSRTTIARTLNIFTAEFSHPEMFIDTGL